MKKETLSNRIKKFKINKYKSFFVASAVALVPSLFRENKIVSYTLPKEITAEILVIGGDTISAADFYKNIKYDNKLENWTYLKKEGGRNSIKYLFNYEHSNKLLMERLEKDSLKNYKIDSYITYIKKYEDIVKKNETKTFSIETFENLKNKTFLDFIAPDKDILEKTEPQKDTPFSPLIKKEIEVYYNKTLRTEGLGAMAFYIANSNSITMTKYRADPNLPKERREKLQELLDSRYNREDLMYNYDHEYHHYLNAKKGIDKYGMSPEQMYLRKCHDELSANLKQFWKQRESYLKNDKDPTKLTSKTSFYDTLVKEGKIMPVYGKKIPKEELKYIAEGMQKVWNETSLEFYGGAHVRYVERRIKNNPAYETTEGTKEYHRILNEIYQYNVNGQEINLYPFIKEFTIPFKDRVKIEKMKNERGFIENDAISYIRETKGQKALTEYISDQKIKYMKKKER